MDKLPELYTHSVKNHNGQTRTLEPYFGDVLIIVNVATNCGLAKKSYVNLADILHRYMHQGLKVLLFPCNGFFQEPGDMKKVKELTSQYSDDFILYSPIDVYGQNKHPIFDYLCKKHDNGWYGSAIKWNFTKFLVDRKGNVLNRYGPGTNIKENDEILLAALKQEIKKE